MTPVRPFPWGSIDATTRSEASALRGLRAWGRSQARVDRIAAALGEIVSARVVVMLRRTQAVAASSVRPLDDGVGVVMAEHAAGRRRGVLLEAEGALAAALASKAIRRPPPRAPDPSRRASANVAGAFAAIAAATLRRASVGVPLRVVASGPSPALVGELAESVSAEALLVASLTVILDDDAYLARIVLPRALALHAAPSAWTRASLRAMGGALIALPIVACSTRADVAEVASLREGDAWMPGRAWRLGFAPLAGPVVLAAPSLDHGHSATLGEDGRIVVGGEVRELSNGCEDPTMTDTKDTDALLEAVGEMPVVVRVEVGSVEMRARDWADLGKGDVVALGRKIAEPVLLRVGTSVIARGELVEIDGEVGVRIVDRLDGSSGGDKKETIS